MVGDSNEAEDVGLALGPVRLLVGDLKGLLLLVDVRLNNLVIFNNDLELDGVVDIEIFG